MTDLSKAPILITGASGGVGVALVDALLAAGMRGLVLQHRGEAQALFDVVKKYDLDAAKVCFRADLIVESEVAALKAHVMATQSTLWGLVNLAGVSSNGMSWKLSLDQFNKVISGNLVTTFLTCREFIPVMREANGGRIINTSSVVGSMGVPGAAHYCAAKAAIVGLTKSIALEVANKGITANAIALGYFNYGMLETVPEGQRGPILARIPVGRFGHAREITGQLRFLLGDDGAYTTGQVLHLNGGMYG